MTCFALVLLLGIGLDTQLICAALLVVALLGFISTLARAKYIAFNTDRFRRHLEAAYVEMRERHQRGEPPGGFAVRQTAALPS